MAIRASRNRHNIEDKRATRMLSAKYNDALGFTADLHSSQTRKQTEIPYISHLMAVSGLVLEHGGDEEEAIAGLLHDAIEDQGTTFTGGVDGLRRVIAERFGQRVLSIVEACSDTDEIPKPPWRERKEAYIAHLKTADASTLLVSCADKVHNARSVLTDYLAIGEKVWDRFKGKRDGTLWYYRALSEAFGERSETPQTLVTELDRVITSLEDCAKNKGC